MPKKVTVLSTKVLKDHFVSQGQAVSQEANCRSYNKKSPNLRDLTQQDVTSPLQRRSAKSHSPFPGSSLQNGDWRIPPPVISWLHHSLQPQMLWDWLVTGKKGWAEELLGCFRSQTWKWHTTFPPTFLGPELGCLAPSVLQGRWKM